MVGDVRKRTIYGMLRPNRSEGSTMAKRFPVDRTNEVRQLRKKARYDVDTVHGILDAGLCAHVAFVQDGGPVVVPMIYGRKDDTIYLHGARKARVIRLLDETDRACMNVTLLDGIVDELPIGDRVRHADAGRGGGRKAGGNAHHQRAHDAGPLGRGS